jgi:hypothetical protein
MILTPHFNKKEFASKDGAGMPEPVWENIKILASQLEALRSHLGKPINVTSGYRSESYIMSALEAKKKPTYTWKSK